MEVTPEARLQLDTRRFVGTFADPSDRPKERASLPTSHMQTDKEEQSGQRTGAGHEH